MNKNSDFPQYSNTHNPSPQNLQQQGYPPQQGYSPQPGDPEARFQATNQNVTINSFSQGEPQIKFVGAIVLSCFVVWCCGVLCGLIAFIIAIVGMSDGRNQTNSKQLLMASYIVSGIGIVVGVGIIIAIIVVFVTNYQNLKVKIPYVTSPTCYTNYLGQKICSDY